VNSIQWSVDAAKVCSSRDAPSSSFQHRFSIFSGLATVLHDNLQQARALDAYAICQPRSCEFNKKSLLEMLQWDKYPQA
jgi:hypothetical protein